MFGDQIDQLLLNFKYAFRPKKPLLFFRLAGAVLRTKLLGRPPLRYVDFSIGWPCNLSCQHCFATSLKQTHRKKMGVADYARIAKQSMKLGSVNFSFQGGEPLLFKNLDKIIAACRPARNLISVTTNGTLLTADQVLRLKRARVDILTISLDSGIASEHDAFRGEEGAMHKAMDGIQLALNAGLRVTLGTVVTPKSLGSEGLKKLVEFAKAQKLLLYLIWPVRAGNWKNSTDMVLNERQQSEVDRLVASSKYIRTDLQANLGPKGCGAVKEILYITPYGDVLPCPFMHISMGNIFEQPISEMRAKSLTNKFFKNYRKKCLVSTDDEFTSKHLSKTYDQKNLPISWDEAFVH